MRCLGVPVGIAGLGEYRGEGFESFLLVPSTVLLKTRSTVGSPCCVAGFLSAVDSAQLAQSISLLSPMLDTLPPLANTPTASTWIHVTQLFDIISKKFKLSLSIYIFLNVDATKVVVPHFIRTLSSIFAFISPRSHPLTC